MNGSRRADPAARARRKTRASRPASATDTARQARQARRDLRAAVHALARRYPWHACYLGLERFHENPAAVTFGVFRRHGRIRYDYAPEFLAGMTREELMAVLHHEVNHVLFGHVDADPDDFPEWRARTIAREVTVNEYVPEPLPGAPVTLTKFPELPAGEDTEQRYRRLEGKPLDGRETLLLQVAGMHDPRSCPDLPTLARLMHEGNGLRPGSAALRAARAAAGGVARRAARRERIERGEKHRATIRWERELKGVLGSSPALGVSFSHPPRRMPELLGIVPAERLLPVRPKLEAVIDTSGSVTPDGLSRVAAEVRKLARVADLTIVECDNEVRAVYPFRGRLREVHGRGGTDFRPALEAALIRRIRPKAVVYFTDGQGHAPSQPPQVPVIWCLSPGGERPTPWGREVRMAA